MKKFILAAMAAATLVGVQAQNLESAYFLDDYTYRFQMNPAFANNHGFFAMPGLGNLNVGVNCNIGVQDLIYNVNGKTTTFLNPGVSTSEALSNIKDYNRIGADVRETILAFGFNGFHGYNTFSISARAGVGAKLPGDLLKMMKEGLTNQTYEIANLKAYGTAFAEIALNHSHDLNKVLPGLRIGATAKVLVGAGNFNMDMQQADLVLGVDDWSVRSRGEMSVNLKGFAYDTDINENTNHRYVNGGDVDGAGVGGYGFAVDLGATYKPQFDIPVLRDFEFSLALLDLGFINWSNNVYATTNGMQEISLGKYTFNVDDNATNNFGDELDRIGDDLSALYELSDMGDTGSATKMLGATVNVGAMYTLPYWGGFRAGLLNTTHIQGAFTWTDFRLSANLVPCKFVGLSANVHTGTFGTGFGGVFSINVPGFNIFVGADTFPTKLSKQYIPLTSSAEINFGLNFLF